MRAHWLFVSRSKGADSMEVIDVCVLFLFFPSLAGRCVFALRVVSLSLFVGGHVAMRL